MATVNLLGRSRRAKDHLKGIRQKEEFSEMAYVYFDGVVSDDAAIHTSADFECSQNNVPWGNIHRKSVISCDQ
jgi:hypothetical protein